MSGAYFEGVDLRSRNRSITAMDLPWTPADLSGGHGIPREPLVDFGVDLADLGALASSKAARAEALLATREARAWAKGDGR